MDNVQKNILVTGGAGFIGSHLCERLVSLGHRVVCLDNFSPFYSPEVKHHNLAALKKNPHFKLVQGDVRNHVYLDRCFAHDQIDTVVHLAAMAGVRPSLKDPELYADVNIMGTLEVLRACQRHKVNQLLFASSSSVYGVKREGAFKESDDLGSPVSPYASSKKAAEILCELWQSILCIPIICLRFFTVYGPRQRPDLAIYKFTKLMYEGRPIPVYGDGTTARDYTYIDDTLDGILAAMDYAEHNNTFEIFNLGESRSISLLDMIAVLENFSCKAAIPDWQPSQVGDVPYTCADLEKSCQLLGYNPKVSFEEGIRKFIAWYEETHHMSS